MRAGRFIRLKLIKLNESAITENMHPYQFTQYITRLVKLKSIATLAIDIQLKCIPLRLDKLLSQK
ncbi:hypothetical protein BK634_25315 [Pseudomonas chlororaphis]|nr:hypothetical protein BK634_25315 [Pseudomonas chlororaphis]